MAQIFITSIESPLTNNKIPIHPPYRDLSLIAGLLCLDCSSKLSRSSQQNFYICSKYQVSWRYKAISFAHTTIVLMVEGSCFGSSHHPIHHMFTYGYVCMASYICIHACSCMYICVSPRLRIYVGVCVIFIHICISLHICRCMCVMIIKLYV